MSTYTPFPPGDLARADIGADRYSELHANHLLLAEFLLDWARELESGLDPTPGPTNEGDFLLGYQRALRDLAGHLTDGDGLPGGAMAAYLMHR